MPQKTVKAPNGKIAPIEANLDKAKWHFDVEIRDRWYPPDDDDPDFGAKLMTMPNIPTPLHMLNPRTIVGATEWNHMRSECYDKAEDVCEICGKRPDDLRNRHAHEIYAIDYVAGTSVFVRTVCLCSKCHLLGIHTGRALTLYKHGSPIYTAETLISGAENAFKIIHDYNVSHPNCKPLRAYGVFLSYIDEPELHDRMYKLAKDYDMKFWLENASPKTTAEWGQWRLIFNGKEYPTPYADHDAWEKAMEENNKEQRKRNGGIDPFAGNKDMDELKELLSKLTKKEVDK